MSMLNPGTAQFYKQTLTSQIKTFLWRKHASRSSMATQMFGNDSISGLKLGLGVYVWWGGFL